MSENRLSDIIKNATAVNLRYSADLLNLSKDYFKAFTEALIQKDDDKVATDAPQDSKPEPKRIPLVVAGAKGETAHAAFAVTNTSNMEGTVTMKVRGEFAGAKVRVEPERLSLKNGEGAIIRILATIGDQVPVNEKHPGVVVVPELGMQVAEFVVCRLPDPPSNSESTPRQADKTKAAR